MSGDDPRRQPEVLEAGGRGQRRRPVMPTRLVAGARRIRASLDARCPQRLRHRMRRPRGWRPGVGWLLLAGAALAVALQAGWSGPGGSGPGAASAGRASDRAADQSGGGASRMSGAADRDETPPLLRRMVSLAHAQGPWRDYVRPDRAGGACPAGPAGFSPPEVVSLALAKAVPGFRVLDSTRTFNQTPGLCSMAVRARNHVGTVTVLEVTPPSGTSTATSGELVRLSSDTQSDGTTMSTAVSAVTGSGWTIEVGSTGPAGSQPSIRQLFLIALDPTLIW